jgi:hypothetical protein
MAEATHAHTTQHDTGWPEQRDDVKPLHKDKDTSGRTQQDDVSRTDVKTYSTRDTKRMREGTEETRAEGRQVVQRQAAEQGQHSSLKWPNAHSTEQDETQHTVDETHLAEGTGLREHIGDGGSENRHEDELKTNCGQRSTQHQH